MSESEPASAGPGEQAAGGDVLAARILDAHRLVAALNGDPEVRKRLQVRLTAICTSLKLPGANKIRGAERLDRLMADAERARCSNPGRSD